MDEKINADLKSLKFIFNKNKSYIVPAIVILASIILFFQVIIPQAGLLFAVQKEAKAASLKLQTLMRNLDLLANVNEDTLDSQLQILNAALPLDKDFVGILNSVYSAAQKAGVGLGNFSFKIGNVSKSENNSDFPVLQLSIPINSSVTAVNNFVETISKSVPLSEVYSVKVGAVSSTVNLSFFYKPLNSSNYSQDARVNPISQRGLILIDQLDEFENTSLAPQ